MIFLKNKKNRGACTVRSSASNGASLPELLIYVAILALILAILINMILVIGKSYGRLKSSRALEAVYQRLNGGAHNPLTASSTAITSLIFRELTNGRTKAIRAELTGQSGEGVAFRSEKFYTTVVLRGSYLNQ